MGKSRKFWWVGCVIAVILALAGCGSTPTGGVDSPLPSPDGVMSPIETPVVAEGESVTMGEWPEGQVLYHANLDGPSLYQIYKVVDGGEPVKLSVGGAIDLSATWSDDGELIAFASYMDAARTNEHIFTMRPDGSERTELIVDQPRLNWRPNLSPDGTQVLFISNRDSNFEIYKAGLDGMFLTNLTRVPESNERDPAWSPDGSKILFVSDRSGANALYVMDTDGTNVQELLDGSWMCSFPVWSPDGTQIAFTSRADGTEDIYIVNADGSDARKITGRSMDNVMPTWVGQDRLMFSGSDGGYSWDLFMINIDGTGLVQLTDTEYSERYPRWHP